jgi:ATP-dependent RNA helicase SUPV3L1/SUV3
MGARLAAANVFGCDFTARAGALAAAPDDAFALSPPGKFVGQGSEIARLKPGETALKPRLQIFADDHLAPLDRERVVKRLEAWLAAHLDAKLKPLMALSEASDLSGLSRGLAFRLTENLGVLRRESASDEIKTLDQTARGQLRKYGVRFGAFNLYFPALLKPASAELLLLLWALHDGEEHGLDPEGLPERPQQGLTSVAVDSAIPEPYWRAAGFHLAGTRAVRIDMLERLSDLIRVRVSWRPAEGGEDAPSGATGDGGFRVEPELMSMVGCSGDEFASILRSLGFRLERKRLEAGEGAAKPADTPAPEAVTETEKPKVEETPAEAAPADETKALSDAASAEPEFDEIWRPGRRKEPHRAARSGPKPQRKERDKKPDKERSKSSQRQPRRNQSQGKGQSQRQAQEHAEQRKANRAREEAAAENSPFAALKDLRKTLAARGRSEQS